MGLDFFCVVKCQSIYHLKFFFEIRDNKICDIFTQTHDVQKLSFVSIALLNDHLLHDENGYKVHSNEIEGIIEKQGKIMWRYIIRMFVAEA
jgi:hypothetical protein